MHAFCMYKYNKKTGTCNIFISFHYNLRDPRVETARASHVPAADLPVHWLEMYHCYIIKAWGLPILHYQTNYGWIWERNFVSKRTDFESFNFSFTLVISILVSPIFTYNIITKSKSKISLISLFLIHIYRPAMRYYSSGGIYSCNFIFWYWSWYSSSSENLLKNYSFLFTNLK